MIRLFSLGEKSRGRLPATLFWAAMLGLCLLGITRSLWTPDEPREAEIGREMYLSPGFIPQLDGTPFLEKPPIYYWTLAGAYTLAGGPSATAARTVSAAMGFLTLLIVFLWCRSFISKNTAYAAVVILAASLQFFRSTHWILLDPMLMLFVTIALWAGFHLVSGHSQWKWVIAFYGGLILALWTKGLVGIAIPLAGIACYALLTGPRKTIGPFKPGLGVLLLASAAALCLSGFYEWGGSGALHQFFWVNHVERVIHPEHTGHIKPFYFYAAALPVAILPWLAPFLALFRRSFWTTRGEGEPPRLRIYLGSVVVAAIVLLSLASTKRETYLLPILPALAILLAISIRDALQIDPTVESRWHRALFGRLQPCFLAVWGVLVPLAVIAYTRSATALSLSALLAAAAVGWVGIRWAGRGRMKMAWKAHCLSAVLFCLFVVGLAMPAINARKDMAPFIRWIGAQMSGSREISAVGADETLRAIVPFTTGKRLRTLTPAELSMEIAASRQPRFLVEQLDSLDRNVLKKGRYILLREERFGRHRVVRLWRVSPKKAISFKKRRRTKLSGLTSDENRGSSP